MTRTPYKAIICQYCRLTKVKILLYKKKNCQYFKQYDAPISDAQIFAGSDKPAVESGILI